MGTTLPIREKEDINKLTDYYKTKHPNVKNYTIIIFSLNTALRISNVLSLRWENVYDFKEDKFLKHLFLKEKRQGKIL